MFSKLKCDCVLQLFLFIYRWELQDFTFKWFAAQQMYCITFPYLFNSFLLEQDGDDQADENLKSNSLNVNIWSSIHQLGTKPKLVHRDI